MKSQNLVLLISISIFGQIFTTSDRALASNCPFDSYIIIGGVCHDMTQEPKNLTLEKAKPASNYNNSDLEDNEPEALVKKQCSDL